MGSQRRRGGRGSSEMGEFWIGEAFYEKGDVHQGPYHYMTIALREVRKREETVSVQNKIDSRRLEQHMK